MWTHLNITYVGNNIPIILCNGRKVNYVYAFMNKLTFYELYNIIKIY